MLRAVRSACVCAVSALVAVAAVAQPPQAETVAPKCPRDALVIYYARGEAAPSEQGALLINRIGQDAARCQPDAIDLITGIDASREGSRAIALATARLNGVAEALVAQGFPADRIRIAAQGEGPVSSPMGGITVMFRHASGADNAAAPTRGGGPPVSRNPV